MKTVIAKNTTVSGISLGDLSGYVIPASGTVNLSELFVFSRLVDAIDLKNQITSSGIIINDGVMDLPSNEALIYLTYEDATSVQNIPVVDPDLSVLQDGFAIRYDDDQFNLNFETFRFDELPDVILDAGKFYIIDGEGNRIPFAQNFNELLDTPATYSGYSGKYLRVDTTESGIEFVDAPTSGSDIKLLSLTSGTLNYGYIDWGVEEIIDTDTYTVASGSDIYVSKDGTYELNYRINWTNNTVNLKSLMVYPQVNKSTIQRGINYGFSPGSDMVYFTIANNMLLDLIDGDNVSLLVPCLVSGEVGDGWYDNDWHYRKKITIDSTQVEADSTSVQVTDTSNAICENAITKTVAHTVGSESNRMVIVAVGSEASDGDEVSGVTYNGVAMTHIITKKEDNNVHNETSLWYMLESSLPSAGTYNVIATMNDTAAHLAVHAWTVTGLKQQAPEATASNGNQGQSSISTNITTLTNNAWVFEAVGHGTTSTWSPSSGQTEDYDAATSSFRFAAGRDVITTAGQTSQGWSNSSSLRISHVLAAFAPDDSSAAHEDFAVYVEMPGLTNIDSAEAYDVIFTTSGTNPTVLDYEIHNYDDTSGDLKAWVRIPELSATEDTCFYIYYNNTTITGSQENSTAVWDSNYEAVLHLQESGSGSDGEYKDSTSNSHHATGGGVAGSGNSSYTPARVSGKMGYAQDYSDDIIRLDNVSDQNWTAVTVQMWINADSYSQDSRIFSKTWGTGSSDIVWMLRVTSVDDLGTRMRTNSATETGYDNSGAEYDTGVWTLATITWDASDNKLRVYKDGVEAGNTTLSGDNLYDYTIEPCIGNSVGRDRDYDGKLQEARLSKIARSASWLKTEFNNQNSPGTFMTIGEEEEGPSCGMDSVTLLSNQSILEMKLLKETS